MDYIEQRYTVCDKLKLSLSHVNEEEAQNWFATLRANIYKNATEDLTLDAAKFAVERLIHHTAYVKTKQGVVRWYSWECTGIVADYILMHLPTYARVNLTYVHTKTYHTAVDVEEYRDMKNRATDGPLFRNVDIFGPRREGNSDKRGALPGIRIGSNKSDLQISLYGKANRPFGIESRCKDVKLKNLINKVKPMVNAPNQEVRFWFWTDLLTAIDDEGKEAVRRIRDELGQDTRKPLYSSELPMGELRSVWEYAQLQDVLAYGLNYDSDGFPDGHKAATEGRWRPNQVADLPSGEITLVSDDIEELPGYGTK